MCDGWVGHHILSYGCAATTTAVRTRRPDGATSGGDCDGQQLRGSDFFGYWLTVSSQAGNVYLDRLDGALAAFLEGAAAGEAPWERRDDDEEAAVLVGLHHDRVGAHLVHPVTARLGVHRR